MGRYRDAMEDEMRLRDLATKTRRHYVRAVKRQLNFTRKTPDQTTYEDLRAYLVDLTKREVGYGVYNHAVCATRLFYREVMKRDWPFERLPYRPKRRRLPVILSQEEILRLLDSAVSLRDRAFLETAYSAGLRRSEATHLHVADIDSKRMVIHVHKGKGGKDRDVMLAQTLLPTLRAYWRKAQPTKWLFPGRKGKGPICPRTASEILFRARAKAGLGQRINFHSLRHSCATHLLESGISLRIIQAVLGHSRFRTTLGYTHVATNYVCETPSPLDFLRRQK